MAISAPKWCSHAVPTRRGWEDPNSGELFASGAFTRKQIEEWEGTNSPEPVVEEASPEPESLMEAPSSKAIDDMSKRELEDLGRQHGIELDRRRSKSDLVQELNDAGIN